MAKSKLVQKKTKPADKKPVDKSKLSSKDDKEEKEEIDRDDVSIGIGEHDENDDENDVEIEEFYNKFEFKDNFHIFNQSIMDESTHREEIIIPKQFRRTSQDLTRKEYTRILSERAKEIENGSAYFVEIGKVSNPKAIAELEIKNKRCPLYIVRIYNNNLKEIWPVNEMGLPFI